jgi:hypothetical protein
MHGHPATLSVLFILLIPDLHFCHLGVTAPLVHSQTTQPTFDFAETKGRYHVIKKIGEGRLTFLSTLCCLFEVEDRPN